MRERNHVLEIAPMLLCENTIMDLEEILKVSIENQIPSANVYLGRRKGCASVLRTHSSRLIKSGGEKIR